MATAARSRPLVGKYAFWVLVDGITQAKFQKASGLGMTLNIGEYREGGQTAPTNDRLGLVKLEIIKLWPSPWRQFADRVDFTGFELCDGSRIRFVSTAPRPERQGLSLIHI